MNDPTIDAKTQRVLKELEEVEKKQKKLERQLNAAGIKIAEDIPYEEAKARVNLAAKRMGEIGSSDVVHPDKDEQKRLRDEYFMLEQDMEKYSTAMVSVDPFCTESRF